jgi:hypothetical protein
MLYIVQWFTVSRKTTDVLHSTCASIILHQWVTESCTLVSGVGKYWPRPRSIRSREALERGSPLSQAQLNLLSSRAFPATPHTESPDPIKLCLNPLPYVTGSPVLRSVSFNCPVNSSTFWRFTPATLESGVGSTWRPVRETLRDTVQEIIRFTKVFSS